MPIFAVFLAFLAAAGSSSDSSDLDYAGNLPTQEVTTASGTAAWPLSPRAECEHAHADETMATPPYCSGMAVRGEIPEDPQQALALAREIMINLQLAFGDSSYDARPSPPNTFPQVSLNFSRQLLLLTNPARLKSHRQNAMSYLDKRTAQQWMARDLEVCALGGSVAGRVKDRGKINQTDAGDTLSIGEFSCLDPRFSTATTTPSFWLYEVANHEHDQLALKASGKMQRDLPGLILQASIPETVLLLDTGPSPRIHYKDAMMSYCIGLRPAEADPDCEQLGVLFEHINLTQANAEHGLNLIGSGRFSMAFDRQLASRNGQEPLRYDITTDNLSSWPGSIMPHQGSVIIMGRHDLRLRLDFQRDGKVTMTRELPGGTAKSFPRHTAAELYAYSDWLQALAGANSLKAAPADAATPSDLPLDPPQEP